MQDAPETIGTVLHIAYPQIFSMPFRKCVYDLVHDFSILLVWLIVQEFFFFPNNIKTTKQSLSPEELLLLDL